MVKKKVGSTENLCRSRREAGRLDKLSGSPASGGCICVVLRLKQNFTTETRRALRFHGDPPDGGAGLVLARVKGAFFVPSPRAALVRGLGQAGAQSNLRKYRK